MKKIILIITIVFLSCGCTAEYNLTIDDLNHLTYDEYFLIESIDKEEIESEYNNVFPSNAYDDEDFFSETTEKIDGVSYYEVEKYYDNKYYIKYHFTFPSNRFDHSVGVKTAFYNFTKKYNEETNTTTLDTGSFDANKFPNLEELIVHVTINNNVVSHNADEVDGNIYTWYITDFENARLLLSYENSTEDKKDHTLLALGIVIVFIICLFTFIIIVNKRKKQRYQ